MLASIKHIRYLAIALIFVFPGTRTAFTAGLDSKRFTIPEVLRPNVEFWKKIYATYSERDVLIHDSEQLNIIYEVVNLDSLFRGVNVSSRIQWKKIERIKKDYITILRKLSRQKHLDISKLSGREKRVATLFANQLSAKKLQRAAKHVRAQSGLRERFREGLIRSGLYLSAMQDIFRKAGLPDELLVLPHVESSFNYRAYSKFGAAGIWQFTRSTGRSFMKIDYAIDERLDPIIATEAAAKLIRKNYAALNSWPLAITAYNHGRNGMLRAKKKYGSDLGIIVQKYRSRTFGFASRNFYAEFIAALEITSDYPHYFGDVQFAKPGNYAVFETPHYITVNALLGKVDVSIDEFAKYNPALRKPVLNSQRRIPKNTRIRIPLHENLDMAEVYAQIASDQKFDRQLSSGWHKVRYGENLSQIATRYRISVHDLMAVNNIRNAHRIYAGQNLQIPASATKTQVVVADLQQKTAKPPQLADATISPKPEHRSVLDVPSSLSEPVTKNQRQQTELLGPLRAKLLLDDADIKPVPTRTAFKTESQYRAAQSALDSIAIHRLDSQTESIEDVMAMALPGFFVQMNRNMQTKIVRAMQVETALPSVRDIHFPRNGQVIVEPDETLGHLADWLGVRATRLRAINSIRRGSGIQVGQPVWLTFERVTPEEFHRRRIEYHQSIEEDFYRNFFVQGQKTHKVRRGENIWILCQRIYDVPYWLVKKTNSQKDLSHLSVGEELVIPVVQAKFTQTTLSGE